MYFIRKIRRCWAAPALALLALSLGSCNLGDKPKTLGAEGKLDFSTVNTSAQSMFNFNFAFRGVTNGGTTTIYLQGTTNAKSSLIGTCNLAGTGCVCEYFNAAGATLATTTPAQISYDDQGNYYRCVYSGDVTAVSKIRIKNIGGTVTSTQLDVLTSPTLGQLLGSELNLNYVRYVFRYSCEFKFLQKAGTTTQGFDCSNQAVSCDPNGDPTRNFCILQTRFPFYLYADNYSTNFSQKISDKLYGGATGAICGQQIKEINCADDASLPAKKFGLYANQTGIFDTSVQLGAGPSISLASYGYAARVSPVTGECPPGLVKKIFYLANGADGVVTTDITPSHNFVSGLASTEIDDPANTPAAFVINKYAQGHCDPAQTPAQCTLPTSYAGAAKTLAYTSAGQTTFCVIPDTMLP